MAFGTCKLTGTRGTFVKCHLLPKALTTPPDRSEVRVEGGDDGHPIARYDSWFDKTLVTRQGEDVFERLDTFAIAELRRHYLVWSSWGDKSKCPVESEEFDGEKGLRKVSFSDPVKMRRFCLSLLWRAAMTNLPGFSTVKISDVRMRLLTELVLSNDATPFEHFPVHLIQLITRGGWHNQTPIKQIREFEEQGEKREVGFFRFYMDGLIIHIEDEIDDPVQWRYKDVALGESKSNFVITLPYENSYQDRLITSHMLNAMSDEKHAAVVERIFANRKKG